MERNKLREIIEQWLFNQPSRDVPGTLGRITGLDYYGIGDNAIDDLVETIKEEEDKE